MTSLTEIKQLQRETWSSGAYGKVAWLTVPLADILCEALDLSAGSRVLDVATGTGHVALAAARRFCDATGIDYVPALLEQARGRAAAEGLTVDFQEADAENLPFPDNSFDYVTSVLGVMFTADHQRAARELMRVCRPGGRIGLVSWTPTGFIGEMLKLVGSYAPPPAGAQPPTRWGTANGLQDLFGAGLADLTLTTATATQRFPTPEFFADFFLAHYGPTHKAAQRLSDDSGWSLRHDLVALAVRSNHADDGTLRSEWEYLLAVATKG